MSLLLDAGAQIDALDELGRSALMFACEKGYIEIVDTLLKAEAGVNTKDNKSKNPLLYAIQAKVENIDIV